MFIKLKKTIVAPKSKILVSVLKYTRWRCNGMIPLTGFRFQAKGLTTEKLLFTFLKLINPFISALLTISLLLFSISIWSFAFSESRDSFYGSFSLFIKTLYRIFQLIHKNVNGLLNKLLSAEMYKNIEFIDILLVNQYNHQENRSLL